LSVLSKRLAALEASLPPPPSQYAIATLCRGDDGFRAALAEIVERNRGKSGGITDQDEVFSISVIKGLNGHGEDLTIIRTVVDPKPEPSPRQARACLRTGIDGQRGSTGEISDIVRPAQTAAAIWGIGQ
jgi:hypothetical protein